MSCKTVLDFPRSIDDYDIEVMTSAIPNKIGAMKSITVPYRITRRITTASLFRSLYEEVMGYGGATCIKTLNIAVRAKCVICPNTAYQRIVEKLANYFVSISVDCPSSVTSGATSPSTYTGGGGSVTIVSSSTGGQIGSGYVAGTIPEPIKTSNPCECKNSCEKNCSDPDKYCVGGSCTRVAIDSVVANVNGKIIEEEALSTREVNFTATVTSENCVKKYSWDFGDGTTSTEQNPTHAYKAAGVYYPKLTVGCTKCGNTVGDSVKAIVYSCTPKGVCKDEFKSCFLHAVGNDVQCSASTLAGLALCAESVPLLCVASGPAYPECLVLAEGACVAAASVVEHTCMVVLGAEVSVCFRDLYNCKQKECKQ